MKHKSNQPTVVAENSLVFDRPFPRSVIAGCRCAFYHT